MEQLTYKQQLKLAQETGISATELYIAEEVDTMTIGYTAEEFEEVCAIVRDTYLDVYAVDITSCATAITRLFSKYTLKEIWGMSAWERLQVYEEEF